MDIDQTKEADRSLRELLQWLSHELNNPLGVVLGHLQRLVRLAGEGDLEPLLAAQRNARRCSELARALASAAELPSLTSDWTGDALIAEIAAQLPQRLPETGG